MKHLRIITILLLSVVTFSCSAQKVLSEVSSIKGVTSVYVGKAMLKLAGASLNISDTNNVMDMSKIINKLTSIEIVQCEDPKTIKKAEPIANKILAKYPFEVLTEINDDGSNVEIAGVMKGNTDTITMLLIKVMEDNELTIILMKGEIDMATLQQALTTD